MQQPYRGRTPGTTARLQRILVATLLDGVPLPEIELGNTLARTSSGSICVLHVLEALMYAPMTPAELAASKEAIHPEASRKLAEALQAATGPGVVEVEGKIEFGVPSEVIEAYATSKRYDVLVLGSRGRAGSVLRRVVQDAHVPILLAPHRRR
jgi:nucleotide-binding universal stress UspA family protein